MDFIKSPNKFRDSTAAPEGRRLADVLLPIVDRVNRRKKCGEVVDTYVELIVRSKMIVDWSNIEDSEFTLSVELSSVFVIGIDGSIDDICAIVISAVGINVSAVVLV